MGTQTDHFNRIGYYGKYSIGDRVFGHYGRIPFVGTVGNDRRINDLVGPEVTIHLDLPMRTATGYTMFIIVNHRDIKRIVNYDQPDTGLRRKTDIS